MKLGIHAYAWCSTWSNDTLDLIDKVKEFGMDFIELPLMRLDLFDAAAVRARLDTVGLEAATSTVLQADTDITSTDESVRASGVEYLKACVQAASDVGARTFRGVIYSEHVKQAARRPTDEEWSWAADCLREAARASRRASGSAWGSSP